MVWGLATGGADGVREVLEHLHAELKRAMALCGAAKLDELTPDLVCQTS
jgi:4-hydroxymandelate oxidase